MGGVTYHDMHGYTALLAASLVSCTLGIFVVLPLATVVLARRVAALSNAERRRLADLAVEYTQGMAVAVVDHDQGSGDVLGANGGRGDATAAQPHHGPSGGELLHRRQRTVNPLETEPRSGTHVEGRSPTSSGNVVAVGHSGGGGARSPRPRAAARVSRAPPAVVSCRRGAGAAALAFVVLWSVLGPVTVCALLAMFGFRTAESAYFLAHAQIAGVCLIGAFGPAASRLVAIWTDSATRGGPWRWGGNIGSSGPSPLCPSSPAAATATSLPLPPASSSELSRPVSPTVPVVQVVADPAQPVAIHASTGTLSLGGTPHASPRGTPMQSPHGSRPATPTGSGAAVASPTARGAAAASADFAAPAPSRGTASTSVPRYVVVYPLLRQPLLALFAAAVAGATLGTNLSTAESVLEHMQSRGSTMLGTAIVVCRLAGTVCLFGCALAWLAAWVRDRGWQMDNMVAAGTWLQRWSRSRTRPGTLAAVAVSLGSLTAFSFALGQFMSTLGSAAELRCVVVIAVFAVWLQIAFVGRACDMQADFDAGGKGFDARRRNHGFGIDPSSGFLEELNPTSPELVGLDEEDDDGGGSGDAAITVGGNSSAAAAAASTGNVAEGAAAGLNGNGAVGAAGADLDVDEAGRHVVIGTANARDGIEAIGAKDRRWWARTVGGAIALALLGAPLYLSVWAVSDGCFAVHPNHISLRYHRWRDGPSCPAAEICHVYATLAETTNEIIINAQFRATGSPDRPAGGDGAAAGVVRVTEIADPERSGNDAVKGDPCADVAAAGPIGDPAVTALRAWRVDNIREEDRWLLQGPVPLAAGRRHFCVEVGWTAAGDGEDGGGSGGDGTAAPAPSEASLSPERTGRALYLRSLPAGNDTVVAIAGGDMEVTQDMDATTGFGSMTRLAIETAGEFPDIAIVGGDIAYGNGMASCYRRWDHWFRTWARHAGAQGTRLLPTTYAIGNHGAGGFEMARTDVAFYGRYFLQSADPDQVAAHPTDRRYYHTHRVADHLEITVLDSEIVTGIGPLDPQTIWFKEVLQRGRRAEDTRVVSYHFPGWPSVTRPAWIGTRSERIRESWGAAMYDANVDLVLEHHFHAYKRTREIARDGKAAGDPDSERGFVVLGDGAWGVSSHSIPVEKWGPVIVAEKKRNVFAMKLKPRGSIAVTIIDENGDNFDSVETRVKNESNVHGLM